MQLLVFQLGEKHFDAHGFSNPLKRRANIVGLYWIVFFGNTGTALMCELATPNRCYELTMSR